MPLGKVFDAGEGRVALDPYMGEYKSLRNKALKQQIDMIPKEFELAQAEEKRLQESLDLQIDKFYEESDAESRKAMENAAAASLMVFDEGGAPEEATEAFRASLPSDEENQLPDDFQVTEDVARAFIAKADEYRKIEAANAKWTTDKNYVESLDSLSRKEKDKVLEAIAKKKATITGTLPDDPGAFGMGSTGDKTQDRMTREVVGGTENLLSSIDRIENQINSMDQSAMGLPGAVTKLVDNMASAVIGFADMFPNATAQIGEQTVKEAALLDAKLYQDMFSGPAAQSAALQANAIGLAYTLARVANPDGRISDADVRHQLQRVLLDKSSKTQMLAAITEVRREVMVNMANYMRINELNQNEKGKTYYDSLMKKVEEIDGPQGDSNLPVVTSDADFAKLQSGQEFVDEDGKRWRKP